MPVGGFAVKAVESPLVAEPRCLRLPFGFLAVTAVEDSSTACRAISGLAVVMGSSSDPGLVAVSAVSTFGSTGAISGSATESGAFHSR